MKAEVLKRSNVKKINKDLYKMDFNKKETFSVALKLFAMFDDIISIKIYWDDDINFKIKINKNNYRYVKLIFSSENSFNIMDLDMNERRIGETNLFQRINNDILNFNELKQETKNEILRYIDFKRNRKKLIWILVDIEHEKYYFLKEKMIKEILLYDIESLYKKNTEIKVYYGKVSKFTIDNYWNYMVKKKKKSVYEQWKSIL